MSSDSATQPRAGHQGIFAPLSALARNTLALLWCRLEMAGLELSLLGRQLLYILLIGALACICIAGALGMLLSMLVYLAWPSLGWFSLPLLAACLLALAMALFWWASARLNSKRLSLPLTLAELRQDYEQLS